MVVPWYGTEIMYSWSAASSGETTRSVRVAVLCEKIQLVISECGESPKTKGNTAGWPLAAAKGLDGCLLKMMGLLGF